MLILWKKQTSICRLFEYQIATLKYQLLFQEIFIFLPMLGSNITKWNAAPVSTFKNVLFEKAMSPLRRMTRQSDLYQVRRVLQ